MLNITFPIYFLLSSILNIHLLNNNLKIPLISLKLSLQTPNNPYSTISKITLYLLLFLILLNLYLHESSKLKGRLNETKVMRGLRDHVHWGIWGSCMRWRIEYKVMGLYLDLWYWKLVHGLTLGNAVFKIFGWIRI